MCQVSRVGKMAFWLFYPLLVMDRVTVCPKMWWKRWFSILKIYLFRTAFCVSFVFLPPAPQIRTVGYIGCESSWTSIIASTNANRHISQIERIVRSRTRKRVSFGCSFFYWTRPITSWNLIEWTLKLFPNLSGSFPHSSRVDSRRQFSNVSLLDRLRQYNPPIVSQM